MRYINVRYLLIYLLTGLLRLSQKLAVKTSAVVTSAKEVMFSSMCSLAGLRRNYSTDFHKI